MTNRDKCTRVGNVLDEAIGILNSGHTDIDKLRLVESLVGNLWGCTDKTAINWNPDAIYDDGSCEYYANEPPEG